MIETIKSFLEISLRRKSVRSLQKTASIPPTILASILQMTQLAPSSFNLQPYKFIIVQSNDSKLAVASAMLGNNANVVSDCCTSVVFLGDREPVHAAKSLLELERKRSIRNVSNYELYSRVSFLTGQGKLANGVKRLALHLLSPLRPSPSVQEDARIWSALNVGIAAQQLMLAAAAHGIDSQPMEGFDEYRLQMSLNIPPDRYFVPLVVSLGYAQSEESSNNTKNKDPDVDLIQSMRDRIIDDRLRFPLEEMCYLDKFGQQWRSTYSVRHEP